MITKILLRLVIVLGVAIIITGAAFGIKYHQEPEWGLYVIGVIELSALLGSYCVLTSLHKIHNTEDSEIWKLNEEIIRLKNELNQKNNEIFELQDNIEELRNIPTVRIQEIKQQFKVLLAKMEFELIDFCNEKMTPRKRFFSKIERHFRNVIQYRGYVHLGTDFDKILVEKKNFNTILISGELCNCQIVEDVKTTSLLREILLNNKELSNKGEDLKELSDLEFWHIEEFKQRVSQGVIINSMKEQINRIAQNYLCFLLSPLGMKIEFSDQLSSSGMPMEKFLNTWNNRHMLPNNISDKP